ncbi:MAG: SnoaL-like domain-containing protein [Phycisphaerales bacterium]
MGKKDKKRKKDKKQNKAEKKALKKAAKAGKKGDKPSKKAGKSLEPVPVSTGKGATPAQIGADLIAMFNKGQFKEIEAKYWSPDIESVEGVGVAMAWRGRKAVDAKNAWWMSDHVLHGASAEGPFVGASGFAVRFRMDVETKSTGQRQNMDEVGVYTVEKGKIVREEFMYATPGA